MQLTIIILVLGAQLIPTSSRTSFRSNILRSFETLLESTDTQTSAHYLPLVPAANSLNVVRPTKFDRSSVDTGCDELGCTLSITSSVNLPAQAGATHVFDLEGTVNTESTQLFIYIAKFDIVHSLDYMYIQPQTSVFAFLSSSDSEEYSICSETCTEDYIDSGSRSAQCGNTTNPRRVSSTVTLTDLSSKFQCGHWTADALTLCQSRVALTSARQFLTYYSVSPSYYIELTICPYLSGQSPTDYCISTNVDPAAFPLSISSQDGSYTIVINSIVDADTTLVGANLVSYTESGNDFIDQTATISPMGWYYTTGVPAFGTLPALGVGAVQTRYVDFTGNRSNDVYISTAFSGLDLSWDLFSCSGEAATASAPMIRIVTTGTITTFAAKAISSSLTKTASKTYSRRKNRNTRDCGITFVIILITAAVVAGAATAAVAITAAQQSCCTRLPGLIDDYASNLLSFMSPVTTRLASVGAELPSSVTYINGQPVDSTLRLTATTTATASLTITANAVSLSYVSGTVDTWSFDELYYFTSSGGSFITITTEVSGTGGSIRLLADNIVFAVSSFTAAYGINTHTIAVTVVDGAASFEICLTDRTDCKHPNNVIADSGPDGGENNAESEGSFGTAAGHTNFIFSLWTFSLTYILWWIVVAVVGLLVLLKFLSYLGPLFRKLSRFVFYYLCCCWLIKSSDAASATLFKTFPYSLPVVAASVDDGTLTCSTVTFAGTLATMPYYTSYNFDANYDFNNPRTASNIFFNSTVGLANLFRITLTDTLGVYSMYSTSLSQGTFTVEFFNTTNTPTMLERANGTIAFVPLNYPELIVFAPMNFRISTSEPRVFHSCWREFALTDFDDTLFIVDRTLRPYVLNGNHYYLSVVYVVYYGTFSANDVLDIIQSEYGDTITTSHLITDKPLVQLTNAVTEIVAYACSTCGSLPLSEEFLNLFKTGAINVFLDSGEVLTAVQVAEPSQSTISVLCERTSSYTYCVGRNYYIFSYNSFVSSYTTVNVALSAFNLPLRKYSQHLHFDLVTTCTGFIAYDLTGGLVCSNDCCVFTDTQMQQIHVITAGQRPTKTFSTTTRQLTYINTTSSVTATLTETDSCSTSNFSDAWNCYIITYPAVFWIMVALTSLIALLLIVLIFIKLSAKCYRYMPFTSTTQSNRKAKKNSRKW